VPKKGNYEPPDVLAVFSFIDLPGVLTIIKGKHIMTNKSTSLIIKDPKRVAAGYKAATTRKANIANKQRAIAITDKLIPIMHRFHASYYSIDDIVKWVADWTTYWKILNRGASASSSDWHVKFLRWAVGGQVKEFVQYCESNPSPESKLALEGIWAVYDFYWPHNASTGYIFGHLWGWLQLELEKPGEKKPMTIEEQKASLKRDCKRIGIEILRFEYNGFGAVFAITDEETR